MSREGIPAVGRVLALDWGASRIGTAISDETQLLASPLGVLARRAGKRLPLGDFLTICEREHPVGLVVGLPLSLDGSFGPAAQAAKDWAMALSDATGLPAALCDERLSSAAANRMLIGEADLSRKKRGKAVDSAAAAWMLQAALDATRR